MTQRKSISKKTRFEVFKRDSFMCQYCGAKAPETILEVDHMNPVSNGGANDMLNLITSCFDCNRGKSDRKISDTSVVEKQRKQIEELNIRRQQLEMILEWKTGLSTLKNDEAIKVSEYIHRLTDYELNESGLSDLRKLIRKFGLNNTMDAIDIAFDKYFLNDTGSFNIAFNKIGGIATNRGKPEHEQKISYIIGVLKNRLSYVNIPVAKSILIECYNDGIDLDAILDFSKGVKNWTEFKNDFRPF